MNRQNNWNGLGERELRLLETIEQVLVDPASHAHDPTSLEGFCAQLARIVPQADDAFRERLESRLVEKIEQSRRGGQAPVVHEKPRSRILQRVITWGTIAAVLAALLLMTFPDLRFAAAQGIEKILAGIFVQSGGPATFMPAPPFTVKQPKYLPEGFKLMATRYAAGTGVVGISQAKQMEATPHTINEAVRQAVERNWGSEPHFVLAYEAPGDQYLIIAERQAKSNEALPPGEPRTVAGHDARLEKREVVFRLTWIDEGTWIQVETTLAETELLRVASSFATSQPPGGANQASGQVPPRDLSFCDPSQRPPSRFMLGQVAGQSFKGSVWIQVPDTLQVPSGISYGSDVMNARDEVLKPALRALQDPNAPMQLLPYSSISSFIHDEAAQCLRPDPHAKGYVVIEVWERQVRLGYGGAGADLKDLAIKALEQEIDRLR